MVGANADRSADLFLEHRARLHRFATQLVGNSSDADDLVQEAFLKVHKHMRNGNIVRAPLSFLFVTVRNLATDNHRKKRISVVDSSTDVDIIKSEGTDLSAERQVISEQELEDLCATIAQLPERMSRAFVLKKIYGFSCREIAEKLGVSTNTVREQVAQSFKKLQAQRDSRKTQKQMNGNATGASRLFKIGPVRKRG